jgi:hypothetical protein
MTTTNGIALLAAVALTGCVPTQFYGAPRVDKGPAGCKASCDAWGMELVGMVKMGEYSDGCICQVRGAVQDGKPAAPPAPAEPPKNPGQSSNPPPSSGGQLAVAGVWVQMQAAAAAAAQQTNRQMGPNSPYGGSQHPYVPHSPVGSPGWRPGLP